MKPNFAAIVLGGTGQVGGAAVAELLAMPECREVVMVTRKPIAARSRVRNVVLDTGAADFAERTAEELLDRLIPAGMPCSAAYKVSDVMQSPHAKARGSVMEIDYPGIGPVKSAGNPIKLSDAPVETRRKSPMVGEHTVEIMHEVGFSDAEIAALRDAKAIAAP